MDDYTATRKKLQNVIKHTDPNIAAARRLSIEKWLKTNKHVAHLKDDELQFLYNVFRDEDCWSGTKLNNTVLGQRLTLGRLNGIENPLATYAMACRYSLKEKIKYFFQIMFVPYKNAFHSLEVDEGGRPIVPTDKNIRNHLLASLEKVNPVCSFWIDKESEEFKIKEYSNVDGFRKAVLVEWIEGVEYFYDRLNPQEREIEIITAVTTLLSLSVKCEYNSAIVLDFCLHEMGDPSKRELLIKLINENHKVYSLLSKLIRNRCFDTVQSIVKCWCYEEVSVPADKILSYRDYELLLSLLVRLILELLYRPELTGSVKKIIMNLWRCDRFSEHKKAAVNLSNGILPILSIASALAGLIVDWKRNSNESYVSFIERENDIHEILLFAKHFSSNENFMKLKDNVVNILRIIGRPVATEGIDRGIDFIGPAEKLFNKVSNPDSSDEEMPYWM